MLIAATDELLLTIQKPIDSSKALCLRPLCGIFLLSSQKTHRATCYWL
jgi:hypothetical protein